jgi:hypothetical protein
LSRRRAERVFTFAAAKSLDEFFFRLLKLTSLVSSSTPLMSISCARLMMTESDFAL